MVVELGAREHRRTVPAARDQHAVGAGAGAVIHARGHHVARRGPRRIQQGGIRARPSQVTTTWQSVLPGLVGAWSQGADGSRSTSHPSTSLRASASKRIPSAPTRYGGATPDLQVAERAHELERVRHEAQPCDFIGKRGIDVDDARLLRPPLERDVVLRAFRCHALHQTAATGCAAVVNDVAISLPLPARPLYQTNLVSTASPEARGLDAKRACGPLRASARRHELHRRAQRQRTTVVAKYQGLPPCGSAGTSFGERPAASSAFAGATNIPMSIRRAPSLAAPGRRNFRVTTTDWSYRACPRRPDRWHPTHPMAQPYHRVRATASAHLYPRSLVSLTILHSFSSASRRR